MDKIVDKFLLSSFLKELVALELGIISVEVRFIIEIIGSWSAS